MQTGTRELGIKEKSTLYDCITTDLIRSNQAIHIKQIWDKQKISDELATFIEKAALHVSDFNDAPNLNSNEEYCRIRQDRRLLD